MTTSLLNSFKVDSPAHLQQLLGKDLNAVSVLYFRADWAEPCKTMDSVTHELAKRHKNVIFLSVRLLSPLLPHSTASNLPPYDPADRSRSFARHLRVVRGRRRPLLHPSPRTDLPSSALFSSTHTYLVYAHRATPSSPASQALSPPSSPPPSSRTPRSPPPSPPHLSSRLQRGLSTNRESK